MSLFAELKRRNVFRVAIAYIVVAWLLLQVIDIVVPLLALPEWVARFFFLLLAVGFPIALIFAWAFEMTPEGLKRESEVDRTHSITSQTGRKLDFVIIGVLAVALAWFAWDKFVAQPASESSAQTAQAPAGTEAAPDEASVPNASAKSVAVIPFVAMSDGPDDEFFADGLTEEILNALAQLPELLVTARTSAFQFKGEDVPPIREIAQSLGVKHIVEGSVRRSGDRLRVTAQLIRAEDEFHLWSQNYDSTSADTIAVQEDIAEQIAAAMDVVLDEDARMDMRRVGLRDVEAFIALQKGRDLYHRSHGEMDQILGLQQANAYFEQVIERVPGFSPAYTLHSDLFIHINNNAVTGQALPNVTDADIAAAQANAVADLEAAYRHARTEEERRNTAFDLAYVSTNWRGITGRLQMALDNSGCDDGVWQGPFANLFGFAEQFRPRAEAVRVCDPLVSTSWFTEARTAMWQGKPADALAIAREGNRVAPGGWLILVLIRAMIAEGLLEEAEQSMESYLQFGEDELAFKALIAAARGDRDAYKQYLGAFQSDPGKTDFWMLLIYAWGGEKAEANALAARMDQHPSSLVPMHLVAYWCMCGAPWELSATPRFAAKIEEGNLAWPPISPMEYPLKDW